MSETFIVAIIVIIVVLVFLFSEMGSNPKCCGTETRRVFSGEGSVYQCDKCKRIQ